MKKVKDTPFSAIRWFVVTLVFLSLTVMVSAASALEPKKASDIVTLESAPDGDCTNGIGFVELFPNGTTGEPFRVPRGKVLVVTSMQLAVTQQTDFLGFKLFREESPPSSVFNTPFIGLVVVDSSEIGSRNVIISPGFVVEHGINLCAQNHFVILYGFLAKDRDKHRGDD